MKLSKKILAALSAAALLATTALFSSCSDAEDDDNKNGTVYATLPESVGENQLKGKTWKRTNTEGDETYSWSFDETTATYTDSETYRQDINTYKYSYDADQKLLYLALQTQSQSWPDNGATLSWSSAEEYIELMKKESEEEGWSVSEATMESALERTNQEFSTRGVRKYTIGDDNSLTLEDYFDGNLPTKCDFYKSFGESELPSEYTSGSISLGEIGFNDSDSTSYSYEYNLSFNSEAKTFSGKLYSQTRADGEEWSDITKLGTLTGTYTTEGIGTSGCKVTLTFTEIPGGVSVIKANTAYELEMDSDSDTYTLVN